MKYNSDNPRQQPESFYRILIVIADLINHFEKKYCYPSQKYILDVLRKRHGFLIERRQLNYALKFMEASGQIERKRRHQKGKDGKLILRSTLYFIKKRGWKLLNRFRKIIGKPFSKDTAKPKASDGPESRVINGHAESLGQIFSNMGYKPEFDPGG